LTSTKDVENKLTLLHYLVETIETKFPDLLTFSEELAYVDKAARVSVETVQKTLHQMDVNIQNLETDLKNIKQPQGDDDKFGEVMGVSFSDMSLLFSLRHSGLHLINLWDSETGF
jgi:diaphanous 2